MSWVLHYYIFTGKNAYILKQNIFLHVQKFQQEQIPKAYFHSISNEEMVGLTWERYQNLSEKNKNKKHQYACEQYRNLSIYRTIFNRLVKKKLNNQKIVVV